MQNYWISQKRLLIMYCIKPNIFIFKLLCANIRHESSKKIQCAKLVFLYTLNMKIEP